MLACLVMSKPNRFDFFCLVAAFAPALSWMLFMTVAPVPTGIYEVNRIAVFAIRALLGASSAIALWALLTTLFRAIKKVTSAGILASVALPAISFLYWALPLAWDIPWQIHAK